MEHAVIQANFYNILLLSVVTFEFLYVFVGINLHLIHSPPCLAIDSKTGSWSYTRARIKSEKLNLFLLSKKYVHVKNKSRRLCIVTTAGNQLSQVCLGCSLSGLVGNTYLL